MSDENAGAGQGDQGTQQNAAGEQQQGTLQGQQKNQDDGQGGQQQGGQDKTLAGGGDGGSQRSAPQEIPENWRTLAAGGDKDIESLLGRYKSVQDVGKALKDMRAELSKRPAGTKNEPPPKDKPEELKAWREANGVPETAEGYGNALALPEGMVLGEADKPIAASFFKAAHDSNMPQSVVNGAMNWYFQHQEQIQIARQNADDDLYDKSSAELREEWGAADFKRNVGAIGSTLGPIFQQHGKDLFAQVLHARLPDGTRLGDRSDITRALADVSLQINPAARLVPSDPAGAMKATKGRLAELRAMLGDPVKSKEYYSSAELQKEFADLLAAEQRLGARAA